MTLTKATRRKGLTHAESKAQTRAKLIAVGRKHFLKQGFQKAVADEITREAGYTRGALYSNFGNKEGLLMEIARESHRTEMAVYKSIADRCTGKEMIDGMRDALIRAMYSPNYYLMIEFEMESCRNKDLHGSFLRFQEEVNLDARELVQKVIFDNPDLDLQVPPEDFIVALDSFRRGLMMRLALPQSDISRERSDRLIAEFFDRFGFKMRERPVHKKRKASAPTKRKSANK